MTKRTSSGRHKRGWTPASRSGPVKVLKPDGSVEYEEALSPGDMGRIASAEEREDPKAAAAIVRRPRRKAQRTEIGERLEQAARSSGTAPAEEPCTPFCGELLGNELWCTGCESEGIHCEPCPSHGLELGPNRGAHDQIKEPRPVGRPFPANRGDPRSEVSR